MTQASESSALLQEAYAGTLDCVHCGLCLSSCPTYRITGNEVSSPRGRIALMRGVAEGRLPLEGVVSKEAALCLGCRACESACPAGVRYGHLLEETRTTLVEQGLRNSWAGRIERMLLRFLLPHSRRLRAAVNLLAVLQTLRLDRLALHLMPVHIAKRAELLPAIPGRKERRPLPMMMPARGKRVGRVALFTGCIMPELFGRVNWATMLALAACGWEVVVPKRQVCCGALQAHAGDRATARRLQARNLEAFDVAEVDAIVMNSAGCGAALREMTLSTGQADAFSAKVRDVSEVLLEAGLPSGLLPIEARICYDDPCHLLHAQGIAEAPRQLLKAIPSLELIAHPEAATCCGAAGTYNLTQAHMAQQILEQKMDALSTISPDFIASGNPGCLMQLAAGVRQRGLTAEVVHPVELFARALPGAFKN